MLGLRIINASANLLQAPTNCGIKTHLLHHVNQRCTEANVMLRGAFRRALRTSTQRRNPGSIKIAPFEREAAPGPVPTRNIYKACVFTAAFGAGCFFGCTVLEYENTRNMMLDRARATKFMFARQKAQLMSQTPLGEWKKKIQQNWDVLTPSNKVFVPICALNVLVFGLWRIPSLRGFMTTYFCSNPAGRAVCWPMFLSTFSHYSPVHLLANMYVLHSFCLPAVAALGKEQFLAVYLTAGVFSSLFSYVHKTITMQAGMSLGASGAIMAILAFVCAIYPDTQLSVIFLPMYTFSAGVALKAIMGLDIIGCVMGWKFFDHAAHLGGALFGLFWAYFGKEVWTQRIPFLTMYHDWRKTK